MYPNTRASKRIDISWIRADLTFRSSSPRPSAAGTDRRELVRGGLIEFKPASMTSTPKK